MRIIVAGGGSAADSRPLDEIFAQWIGPKGRLLYWPVAQRGIRPFESCYDWIRSTFSPFGIPEISMWTELAGHQESELNEFDAVYIGGGNTYSLLQEMCQSGFDGYIKAYARRGRPVYGGSAGAAILGRDIQTVSHMDVNEVGIVDTTGLNLAQGYGIWVHYERQQDELIHSYVQGSGVPVLALSERAGMVVENSGLRNGGFEPVFRFDANGKTLF